MYYIIYLFCLYWDIVLPTRLQHIIKKRYVNITFKEFCTEFKFISRTLMLWYTDYGRTVRKSPSLQCTAQPKINSHSQIFRYGRSIFCQPHRPKFSDFFGLYLHWVSVVCAMIQCFAKFAGLVEKYNGVNLKFLVRQLYLDSLQFICVSFEFWAAFLMGMIRAF